MIVKGKKIVGQIFERWSINKKMLMNKTVNFLP